MFYTQEIYRVIPDKMNTYEQTYRDYLIPAKIKNGAKLVGWWQRMNEYELMAIWEFSDYQEYMKIEELVKNDVMYQDAQNQARHLGLFYHSHETRFLTSLASVEESKHSISVSGYITNEKGDALLVRTHWRSDTWELPGGGVDAGETLDEACIREIKEETGIEAKLKGVTGVYSNGSLVSVVFKGEVIGGELQTSPETKDVQFIKLNSANIHQFITRGKFKPRVLDAMNGHAVPYESFSVRPYQLLRRLEGDKE